MGLVVAALACALPSCGENKPAAPVVADENPVKQEPAQPLGYESFVANREFHHCDALSPKSRDNQEERDSSIGNEYTITNSGSLTLKNVELTVTLTVCKTRKKEEQENFTKKLDPVNWAPGASQSVYGATGTYDVVRIDLKGNATADGKDVLLKATLTPRGK